MKKLYFLISFLLITSLLFSQELMVNGTFESWDDPTTPTSYSKAESTSQESTEIHGGSYSAKQVAGSTQDITQEISGITPGNNYTITIWYKVESGDGTDARIWSYWLNGTSTVTDANTDAELRGPNNSYFDNNGNIWSEYTVTVTAPNGVDGFRFEVRAYNGSTVYWDDFSFFEEPPSTDPTIALINGPASGSTVDLGPEDLSGELEFVVTNFNVDTEGNGGDGYIVWTVLNTTSVTTHDSGGPLYDLTPDPFIPLEPNNSYYFVAQLINYGSGSVAAEYDLNINTLGYNVVADIADLRAETEDLYYEITGEVIVSFVTGNSRNQIFIQDATGGILIDDPDGIISTLYNNNDGITGLKGMLTSFGNVSQIIPTIDPGAASSTSNTITPLSVTINDLINNIDSYESELVQITDVTFAAGDGVTAFASSTDYDISDQSGGPLVFRTNYPNDNMAGELIPNTPTTIIVIAGQYFNTIQVYPLSPSITLSSSKYNQIEGFAMYPNPTSLGYVNIISKNQSALRVGVHDILGKQVINKTISNNRLDVSTLTTGIYIIKISQDDAITTRKLIIK